MHDELERLRVGNAGLRRAIARACAGYPDDDTAPTCVAILRAALKPNVGVEPHVGMTVLDYHDDDALRFLQLVQRREGRKRGGAV
jgi:hypothetical protein